MRVGGIIYWRYKYDAGAAKCRQGLAAPAPVVGRYRDVEVPRAVGCPALQINRTDREHMAATGVRRLTTPVPQTGSAL